MMRSSLLTSVLTVAAAIWAVTAAACAAAAAPAYTAVVLPSGGYEGTYGQATAGGQQVGYSWGTASSHALLWSGSGSAIDLHPAGFSFSQAMGTNGTRQVGYGGAIAYGQFHALLWSGTAASAVDLHPAGYTASSAYAIEGNQAVGFAHSPADDRAHAMVWDLTSGLATDLHPVTGFSMSSAYGTDGTRQVGFGEVTGNPGEDHALLWFGTAASVIDLHPAGASYSLAMGISGQQIVGQANGLAALWDGPTHTYINLGYQGVAYATNGVQQVGAFSSHAALWSGSAASFVDLQQFLPPEFVGSAARGIDANGVIVGTASGPNGLQAVLWVPVVPELGGFVGFGVALAVAASRRRGHLRLPGSASPSPPLKADGGSHGQTVG
jgi:hypothetical protein